MGRQGSQKTMDVEQHKKRRVPSLSASIVFEAAFSARLLSPVRVKNILHTPIISLLYPAPLIISRTIHLHEIRARSNDNIRHRDVHSRWNDIGTKLSNSTPKKYASPLVTENGEC